uniref:Uncharacterized protein n=2 Tax=Meloidogyne incognita group TaxID=654580 RepID=A0A914LYQ1_MELIC
MLELLFYISSFLLIKLLPVIAYSHLLFDSKNGRAEVEDSPYLIKHPHLLGDFYSQVELVQELAELKTSVRHQQVLIEKRYDDDDPQIENKIRATNLDCIRSKNFELQPENFLTVYPFDLVLIDGKYELKSIVLKPFGEQFQFSDKEVEDKEIDCGVISDDYQKISQEFSSSSENYEEPGLAEGIKIEEMKLRGNPQNALNCLFNYLLMEKDNIPARFQLGIIQLRLGNYKRAIEHLEFINNKVPNCAKCLLPLGDAYVLDGNFSEAIDTFDKALRLETDLDLALTKVSLLRCINKIFEVMENQHENLLDTIKDVEMFKEKMRRIYQLEELIESNRAPVEARLQAKLAYEHFEYGALPFANCREGIQWNGGRRERKRLFCTVNNWKLYNESLNKQREKVKAEIELIINQQFEASPELKFVELDRLKRKANDEIREEKRLSEWKEYISKLAPFIGIGLEMDEPQLIPKYPILDKQNEASFPFFRPSWPSIHECQEAVNSGTLSFETSFNDFKSPQLFISPENKGFM